MKQVAFSPYVNERLIGESNSLCNRSHDHFETNDNVVKFLCFLMIKVAHHLQHVKCAALPVGEEQNTLDTYKLVEWVERL